MKRKLALVLSIMMVFTAVMGGFVAPVFADAHDADEYRIAGDDRFQTAQRIAEQNDENPETVIIVRGDGLAEDPNVVDGLTASGLAGTENAQILLVQEDRIPTFTAAALTSLDPTNVIIVGGESAVSAGVEAELVADGYNVDRVEGERRESTAAAVAMEMGVAKDNTAIIVDGFAKVDSLVAGPLAHQGHPILMVNNGQGTIPQATLDAIDELGIENLVVVGGEHVVSADLATELSEIEGVSVSRLAGDTRVETAIAVAEFAAFDDFTSVSLVNGWSYVDAVAASTLGEPVIYLDLRQDRDWASDQNAEALALLQTKVGFQAIGGPVAIAETIVTDAMGQIVQAPEALEVESVSAINATQVVVNFNDEVAAASAQTVSNYSIDGVPPASAVRNADSKSVTLTFTNASEVEVTDEILVVEPVESATDADETSARYTQIFTFKDTVKPEITNVRAVTNSTAATSATITFSEPIASGTIKVNGVDQAYTAGTSSVTITGLNLAANQSHTVEVVNLTDKASTPNVTAYASMDFTVTVDNVKPVVESVAPYSDTSVLLTFSKAMDVGTVDITNIVVKDELLSDLTVSSINPLPGSTTQFVVQLDKAANANFYQTVSTRNLTVVFNASVADSIGNTLSATTRTVSLTKDTTKPAVTDIVVNKTSTTLVSIVVKYDKNLDSTSTVPANDLVIVNENGVLRTAGSFLNDGTISGREVTFSFSSQPTDTSWSVTAPAALVSDTALAPNTSTAMSKTLDLTVGTAPSGTMTFNGTVTQPDNNTLVVDYASGTPAFTGMVKGGAVAGSATNPSNYSINNVALPSNTVIVLDSAQQEATISLPAGFLSTSDSAAVFRINNVQTTTDLVINPVVMTVTLTENTAPTASIPATSGLNNSATRLVVTFSEELYVGSPLVAVANNADIVANFDLTGTGTISSAIYDQAAKTVTFTLSGVANGDVLKANAGELFDAAGNAYVPENIIFSTTNGIWAK